MAILGFCPSHVARKWDDRATQRVVRVDGWLLSAPASQLSAIAADHDLDVVRRLPDLGYLVIRADRASAAALSADPRVLSLSADETLEISGGCCSGAGDAALSPEAFAHADAELEAAYGALRALPGAREVVVAVLDTGFDAEHPSLRNHLAGRSFVSGARWDSDENGHGTAMASLVAASGDADHADHTHQAEGADHADALVGVAPQAHLLPVRVADAKGRALASQVAAGITWAADQGADVILIALGARRPLPILAQALRYAEERGALVIAAAGNENAHTERYPAADPQVLSVGALDRDGSLAFTTALAHGTDLLAPGVSQLAALPNGRHASVTGTSAAAARIAGVAALALRARKLAPASLRDLLRGARRPYFADDAQLRRAFPTGPLDAQALADALRAPAPRLVLREARVFPSQAAAGESVRALVEVSNAGLRAAPATSLEVSLGEETQVLAVPALAPGAQLTLSCSFTAAGAAPLRFALGRERAGCELGASAAGGRSDRALVALRLALSGDVIATLEGRGVEARGGTLVLSARGRELSRVAVAPLAAGELREVSLALSAAQTKALGAGIVPLSAAFLEQDDAPADDAACLDVALNAGEGEVELTTQYQQSGKVNIVSDAPWRLAPGRAWLPLLVFVPEKGDLDPNTAVELSRFRVSVKQAASNAATGQVIYEDSFGGRPIAPTSLVIVDEYGQVQTLSGNGQGALDQRLFQHQPISIPGRYAILRLPRNAFGLGASQAQDEVRFIEVVSEWRLVRGFLNAPTTVKRGTTRKLLQVRFAANTRPRLPEGGAYFDAHVHTVAEWYQDQSFDPIAPRKNWGGPIPMLAEGAYALGMTESLSGVKDRVITTDHNAFYNDGDSYRDRPLWGPTSLAGAPGKSEWDTMGELFGLARGEEIAFAGTTRINPLLNLPLGAHALTYRAAHVQGPWHGGSDFARALGDTAPDLNLGDVLFELTKTRPQENAKAAIYAAHPFAESNAWTDEHIDLAFERDPSKRTDRTVKVGERGFVTKGLQLWNGEFGRHQLPTDEIDFDQVNPWLNQTYVQGNESWDAELNRGLIRWHGEMSGLLEYELAGLPGVRFPRKMFASAGTDAHGDFNLTEDRLGTIFDVKSTFLLDRSAFGRVLTYAMPGEGLAANAEQTMEAMLDGNSVLTDGPVLRLDLDAEDRFDAATLRWNEQAPAYSDRDGRIGGGGAFDGRGTALVRRGSGHARLGYRYASSPEWGEVKSIAVYRTSVNDPNPAGTRASGAPYLQPRGYLEAKGAEVQHDEALDPREEGLINSPTVLSAAAYTGNAINPKADDGRCLTNPIWAVPFDAEAVVGRVEVDAAGRGVIPAGELVVSFDFDMSLMPRDYRVEIKALDASGATSDQSVGPIDVLVPVTGSGWSDRPRVQDSNYTLVNQRPIPLDLERFGGADRVVFAVYFYDAPQDSFGNELNRIAFTFATRGAGTGGGTGPALARAGAATTAAATQAPIAGGAGGSGGCSLRAEAAPAGAATWLALLALILTLGAARARVEVRAARA